MIVNNLLIFSSHLNKFDNDYLRTGEKLTVAKGKSDIEEDACCLCKVSGVILNNKYLLDKSH